MTLLYDPVIKYNPPVTPLLLLSFLPFLPPPCSTPPPHWDPLSPETPLPVEFEAFIGEIMSKFTFDLEMKTTGR